MSENMCNLYICYYYKMHMFSKSITEMHNCRAKMPRICEFSPVPTFCARSACS